MKIVKAENEALLEKIYRLRYRVLCEEIETLDRSDYPEGMERDRYDPYAEQYAILSDTGELMGCFRLIYRCPLGFPTLNVMHMTDLLDRIDGERLCEISRITIDKKYRSLPRTMEVFRLIMIYGCPFMKRKRMDHLLCAVEENLYRLLRMADVPFRKIGDAQEYLQRYRYPTLLSMRELAEKQPKFCKFR